jgi:phosphoglycolate phosphatase
MKRTYSAAIFDLDGTLIDSRPGVQEAIEYAVRKVLPSHPVVDFAPFIGPPIKKILTNALGQLDEVELNKISMEFREVFDSGLCLKCEIYPGVLEILDELEANGVPIYLATNKPRAATHLVLNQLGLYSYFRGIKSPDPASGIDAPKEVMVRELMESEVLDAGKTVMVGDTMEDWDAARASLIGFAACVYGYGLKEEAVNGDCLILKKIEDLRAHFLSKI